MNRLLIAYPQSITAASPASLATGEVVLDLYKDEVIPFEFKIDDFTNVAEKSSSNSKSFEIPGTKNNNLFFNHIYEVTSDSLFNPHNKTRVVYKENGVDIFSGYMQLNDIVIKNNNVSYEITLFSETINLKDAIENKVLRDLDFTELNHDYTEVNIDKSITGVLVLLNTIAAGSFAGTAGTNITSVVKYPFVRWNYNITTGGTSIISPANLTDVFRPWINCRYILQRILSEAGYTYTSTFLDSTDFSKLFIDFNNNVEFNAFSDMIATTAPNSTVYSTTFQNVQFTTLSGGTNIVPSTYYDTATNKFTALSDGTKVQLNIQLKISTANSGAGIMRLVHNNTSNATNPTSPLILYYNTVSNNSTMAAITPVITLDAGETIEIEILKSNATATLQASSSILWYLESNTTFLNNNLDGKRGDLNQWSYLKSFIDKFNLLIMADEGNPNNLIIEPYNNWVDTGNLIDWTNKIDDREIKFSPIEKLSRGVNFKHEKDDGDRINISQNNPDEWKYNYQFTADIDIVDEKITTIEVKDIASTAINAVSVWGGELLTPYIIAPSPPPDNWDNKARILYDNGLKTLLTVGYSVGTFSDERDYLLFSPLDSHPITSNTKSYDFGVVNYGIGGGTVLHGLYNEYWAKYIDELYHKDTRIAKVKAFLSARDISEFRFNDVIIIRNKKYRVKKIDYNQNHLSTLELITIKDL